MCFFIDKTAPVFLSLSPSQDFSTRESQLEILGKVDEAHQVTINGIEVALVDNQFTKAVTLELGENIFTIIASDLAGNTVRHSFIATYIVDEDGPVLTVTSPVDNSYLNTTPIVVTGQVSDESQVKYVRVKDILAELSGENFTCANVHLSEGENNLVIGSEDEWGNQSFVELHIILDTQKGKILLVQPAANAYLNTHQVLVKGEVQDDSPVTLQINGKAVDVIDNQFETTLQVTDGTMHISMILTDKASNISVDELDIYINTVVPTV